MKGSNARILTIPVQVMYHNLMQSQNNLEEIIFEILYNLIIKKHVKN